MGLNFFSRRVSQEEREMTLRILAVAEKMAESARLQSEAAIRLTERMIPEAEGQPECWTNMQEIPFTPLIGRKHE